MAAFKDRVDGERLAASVALIRADAGGLAAHFGNPITLTALGAGCAMRPDTRLNIVVGDLFVVKFRAGQDRRGGVSVLPLIFRRSA